MPHSTSGQCRTLLCWVQALRQGLALGDAVVKRAALELATELNITDFKASDHWVLNFKRRNGIREYVKHGEAAAADYDKADEAKRHVPEFMMLKASLFQGDLKKISASG